MRMRVAKLEIDLAMTQASRTPWWQRMSLGDIAAELSATFDIGLPLAVEIAKWIVAPVTALRSADLAETEKPDRIAKAE
jgi:hypothetical protein